MESYKTRYLHLKDDFAYISVSVCFASFFLLLLLFYIVIVFLCILLYQYHKTLIRKCLLFLKVDGKKFSLSEDGIQVVVVDGHYGKVVDHVSFRNSILQGIPGQIDNYVSNIRDK